MTSEPIVHVIDDDDAARESLEFLLRAARFNVRSYDSAAGFLDSVAELKAGCIVTDLRMPEISGIDLLARLGDMRVAVPVIVITGHADIPLAVQAMKLGALDFLEKPFDDQTLISAVRYALDQQTKDHNRDADRADIASRLSTLSKREREVLDGLIAGHPNKTIAYDLGISPRTVEIYRAHVMTKMDAASLSHLVRMAVIAGALDARQPESGPARDLPSC